MKIAICGSMHFAKQMREAKKELEKAGHKTLLPGDVDDCLKNPDLKTNFENDFEGELKHCLNRNLLREGVDKIKVSDALLLINHTKNEISGYIGTSGLMELGVAFFLNKKIFLLNPVDKKQKYALEVELTKPTVLNGDLKNIPSS